MRIYTLFVSTAFTVSLFVSASLAAGGTIKTSDIEAELNAFNDHFNQLVTEKDMEGFLSLYSENTLWIAPATPPVNGHGEPRETFQFIIDKDGKLTHTVDKLFVSDDGSQAVMIGTAEILVEKVGMDATGTYLFVLERDGNGWKIVTDMWHQHSDESSSH